MTRLWDPIRIGSIELKNRLAMAPMTRDRSTPAGVPTQLNAEYYAQRASNGLIISEGTQPSEDGQGYLLTPGIYTADQIDGWRGVTEAVHGLGGRMVIQLMHVGRISHPANTPHGRQPVAPSAVKPSGKMFTASGLQDLLTPRALEADEIGSTVQDFRCAARAAIAAGADAVEIHGANGYLLQQFLSSNANQRTDNYGGSIANRIRFAVEVAAAVSEEIGGERTGIRISPGNPFNDIVEHDMPELYTALVSELGQLGLAYLHVMHGGNEDLLDTLRETWAGALLVNRAGASLEERIADVETGRADVTTVGTMALANPDLAARIRAGEGLNEADPTTFYGGDDRGYTDYPTLETVTSGANFGG